MNIEDIVKDIKKMSDDEIMTKVEAIRKSRGISKKEPKEKKSSKKGLTSAFAGMGQEEKDALLKALQEVDDAGDE